MPVQVIQRILRLPDRSFFLFGPRGAGKSTWLKQIFPAAPYFDLLDAVLVLELAGDLHRLEGMIGKRPSRSWVVLDEVQKLPMILDEVHRLMESRKWRFALCGSSARKLRRGGTNLLAGRAITRHMEAFCSKEVGFKTFDVDFSLQWGMLPLVQTDPRNAADILHSYVNTYIKEEIKEEGIVRNIPPFLRFVSVAGQLNGQQVNAQNIAREASIPRSTVDNYFSILQDTLLAHFLPAFRPNVKVREQAHPKFYWFDPGVARAAAGLLFEPLDRSWAGMALETLVFHELRVYNHTSGKNRDLYYYRTPAGVEIDFIIETRKKRPGSSAHVVCVEVKSNNRWNGKWTEPLRSFNDSERIRVDRRIGVYLGDRKYHFDGVDVMPLRHFLLDLHAGKIF